MEVRTSHLQLRQALGVKSPSQMSDQLWSTITRRRNEFCRRLKPLGGLFVAVALACSPPDSGSKYSFSPSEIIDLGAPITEDLPARVWGRGLMNQMGFNRQNSFDVLAWSFSRRREAASRDRKRYYTLFNHGGPHVERRTTWASAAASTPIRSRRSPGPVRVFDVGSHDIGRSVPATVFEGRVDPGDIVLIYTRYAPPATDAALPEVTTLTHEAAEFLATLPVRAYGTDAFSVESLADMAMPLIHHSFLSRGIPIYEQLFNVEALLGKQRMFFVGVPLNIQNGDGMIVRPVVFVY